jgi:hypothetical protein
MRFGFGDHHLVKETRSRVPLEIVSIVSTEPTNGKEYTCSPK